MAALEDLLDRAASALTSGNLVDLAALTPLIEASAAQPVPDRATAERLRQKAQRNARLLEAATRGLRAARTRLREIAEGPTLTTYDARGQKAQIASPGLQAARRV
jgi:hypothetical protein